MKTRLFAIAAILAITAFWGLDRADAFSGPSAGVVAFSIDCGSGTADGGVNGPVTIASSKVGAIAYRVDNPSTTVVYLGNRDVRGDGTAGYPICTTATTCSDSVLTLDARNLHCAAASSVTVNVIALTNGSI